MTTGFLPVAAPLLCLMANVSVQMLAFRLRPEFGLLRSEYLGFAAGLAGVIALHLVHLSSVPLPGYGDIAGGALQSLISYAALGYCYFHFVNLGETARRIRLLRELQDGGGRLSHRQLLTRYNAAEIVGRRLKRLLGTGQIVLRDERYFIGNPAVLSIAKAMVMLKVLLLGKTSEYDA
jgi:hypothetical protein